MSEAQRTSIFKNVVAGGVAGMCAVLSGHPFDTIKVRLQAQSPRNPLYAGSLDCLKKTVRGEGLSALYKGMSAPLVVATPIFALGFAGFALGKKIQQTSPDEALNTSQLAIAGAFSGMVATIVMAPGERVKCLLQVQSSNKARGPVALIRSLMAEGGIASLYKGTVATLARDVPASAAYYASYEIIQRKLAPDGDRSRISVGRTVLAGGTAGICNWLVAIPADVVKSRLQTAPEGMYSGTMDVLRKLLKAEGMAALYTGAVPVLLRAFPANACCFLGFECTMYLLNMVDTNT